MTEKTGEQQERIQMGSEFSPAEHLFFIGSSTFFNGEIVNSSTLDQHLVQPDFISFFLRPIALGKNSSEHTVNAINKTREEEIKLFGPLFLGAEHVVNQIDNRFYVKIPPFNSAVDLLEPQWKVRVEDKEGNKLDPEEVKRMQHYTPANSLLSFSYDKKENKLVIKLNLPNTDK